ncbi:MAG TPA: glycerol-3-phosphate dehydrogenase/oxidase [Polyangiaceae bacterium]|jgi:glycerol-3-phosphate dehydrogenase|nr:glycerol-3-phosphate dehydrogenase/oxidase [Polyangiaceae bacterium]
MQSQPASDRIDVDVIVIGGGVNGTGVARDAALRGLRVALFERNDLAFGASGNSSGMIHGGPRYLTYDPDVTYTSCLDSGHIQSIAPHLLFRIPFLMPVQKRFGSKVELFALDAFFDLYDRYQPLKHGKEHVLLDEDDVRRLEPGIAGELEGGVSFDEWGIDGARLCVANAVDAHEHGAEIRTHCTVTELLRGDGGRVTGIRFRDRITGETGSRSAPVVVNATGAWAPLTNALGAVESRAAKIRPGKGVHVFFDRRLTNYAIVCRAIDGRQVFMEPWQNMTVLGTTDDDYYGDLDDCVATTDEVRYLVQAVERVFPAIRFARSIGTWAGVRPTLFEWGPNEDALSRDHRVVDHAADGVDGLYSMVGGKLASYRLFSEEATDVVAARLGRSQKSSTHTSPLPGGEKELDPLLFAKAHHIEPMTATRLLYRHGTRAERILARVHRAPAEGATLCTCEPVIEAEVRYTVDCEWARSVDDVARRTRLGLGACGGMRCAARCGAIVAEMTDRSPAEGRVLALEFLERARRKRAPAMGPVQAREEALALASLRASLGTKAAAGPE